MKRAPKIVWCKSIHETTEFKPLTVIENMCKMSLKVPRNQWLQAKWFIIVTCSIMCQRTLSGRHLPMHLTRYSLWLWFVTCKGKRYSTHKLRFTINLFITTKMCVSQPTMAHNRRHWQNAEHMFYSKVPFVHFITKNGVRSGEPAISTTTNKQFGVQLQQHHDLSRLRHRDLTPTLFIAAPSLTCNICRFFLIHTQKLPRCFPSAFYPSSRYTVNCNIWKLVHSLVKWNRYIHFLQIHEPPPPLGQSGPKPPSVPPSGDHHLESWPSSRIFWTATASWSDRAPLLWHLELSGDHQLASPPLPITKFLGPANLT